MKKLLFPAVLLLNKLNYPRKFFIVAVVILSAFLTVSYSLIIQLNKTISTAELQLNGLSKVRIISKVIQEMQEHRGHDSAIKARKKYDHISRQNHLAQQAQNRRHIKQLFLSIENEYPESLLTTANWRSITGRWEYLVTADVTMGLNGGFTSHTQLIRKLLAFQSLTSDYYQLSTAPDLGAHYILDTVLIQLPYSIETLGQIRALGVTILASHEITTSQENKLSRLMLDTKRPLTLLRDNLRRSSLANEHFNESNKTVSDDIFSSFRDIIYQTKTEVLSGLFTADADNYFLAMSKIINQNYSSLNSLLDNLESLSKQRILQSQHYLYSNLIFLGVILFLVIYALIAIAYSIITATHHLSNTARLFATGNRSVRINLNTNDELKNVGDNFNLVANNFNQLLAIEYETNNALVEQKSNLDAFFENMDSGVAIYDITPDKQNFIFVNINQSAENIDNLKRKNIVGHKVTDIFPGIKAFGLFDVLMEVWLTGQAQNHPISLYKDSHVISWRENYIYKLPNGHIVAIYKDVSKKKQNEEALELALLVYQNSTEAMMVTDSENKIIAINPAFTTMTGYQEKDVLNQSPKMLSGGDENKHLYNGLWRELSSTGKWQGEIVNKRKNGKKLIEWLTINTICRSDGSVYRYVALFSDITQKKQAEEIIWQQANYDGLTGLPNRRMFRDRLEMEVKKSHRTDNTLALLFLDLDNFKEVNDTQGHDAGDILLIEASHRIKNAVRETDTIARLGGDEFTIILSELDDLNHVEIICQKILSALNQPFDINHLQLYVSASIGITLYPNDAKTASDLLKNADQAMYLAKDLGRNQFCYFTSSMQESAQVRLELLSDLRVAIERDQLEVYYQPIVDLHTGSIRKAEALIRWNHPDKGLVSPAEFIPLAEETGLIVNIGDWVFEQAVKQVKRCKEEYDIRVQISVNKSPIQFKFNEEHSDWLELLVHHNVSGEDVVIEITENLLLDNDKSIMKQLHTFRDAGIEVSMDDFGTGYSSLSYLKKFDIDYLKIDQSFTRGVAAESEDLVLSEAIIIMAHKLGLKVIAEGIETDEQRKLLIEAGCDYGQGYFFSKPVPSIAFEKLLNIS